MQIRVRTEAGGGATVWVVDRDGESVDDSTRNLEPGQELTVTAVTAHEPSDIEVGDVVAPETPAEEVTEEPQAQTDAPPVDEESGETTPEDEVTEGEQPTDSVAGELPAGLGLGRVVIYRSKTGSYDLPAIVNCTVATLDPAGVAAGHVPELTNQARVHLTVFTCGKQGTAREGNEVNNEAAGGSYQEFNIPQFVVPELGAEDEAPEIPAGTWRWPERV